jgi:hypothetical protein
VSMLEFLASLFDVLTIKQLFGLFNFMLLFDFLATITLTSVLMEFQIHML